MNELFLLAQSAEADERVLNTLLQTDKLIPCLAIVGGLSCVTLWAAMHYFYSWVELCKNNELKLRMIEAGHSAEEIERVVCAGKTNEEDGQGKKIAQESRRAMRVPPAKQIPQHVA